MSRAVLNMFGVNAKNNAYLIIFADDGSAWALNVNTLVMVEIAPEGTFGTDQDVTVWQGTTVLIVDSMKGYFSWPAVGGLAPSVRTITAPIATPQDTGAGHLNPAGKRRWAVTFVIGTESSLGTPSAIIDKLSTQQTVQLDSIPTGPTGTTARKIYRTPAGDSPPFQLVTTINDNTTTSYNDVLNDSGLGASAPSFGNVDAGTHRWAVTFVGSSGAESPLGNPSIQLNVGLEGNTVYLSNIPLGPAGTASRNIYRTEAGDTGPFFLIGSIGDNTTTTFTDDIADGTFSPVVEAPEVGIGSVSLIDATHIGTSIATFAGRVWIANNRTITFTAPNSINNFDPGAAAGAFIMTDVAFIGNIKKLLSALDVLWIFGETSINQLSNVQVVSGATTFSNVNISASVGSIFPKSVLPYLRQIIFASAYGIYSQIGVTPDRISKDIDNTFEKIDQAQPIMGALCVLHDILCYVLFCHYIDDDLGITRPVMLTYFDQKWFVTSQGNNVVAIASVETGGKWRIFGTDGVKFFELFVVEGYPIHRLKTGLTDFNDEIVTKEFTRLQVALSTKISLDMTVVPQTEGGAQPIDNPALSATVKSELIFTGYDEVPLWFVDDADVLGSNKLHFVGDDRHPEILFGRWMVGGTFGKMVGFNLELNSDPFVITGYTTDISFRDIW